MRSLIAAFQLSLLLAALTSAHPSDISPFILALDDPTTISFNNETAPQTEPEGDAFELLKRQSCPATYNSCSSVGGGGSCCIIDSICSLDNAGNVACCPIGSFCTGIVSSPAASTVTEVMTTTSSGVVVVITSMSATTVAASAPAPAPVGTTVTYVSNPYYSFPIIGTNFPNAAACASAYSGCASNSAQCLVNLQTGAGFGVTVSAPGGGVTVVPTAGMSLSPASATSICSSLSSVACPGTGETCAALVSAGATATTFVVGGGAGRRLGDLSWSLIAWTVGTTMGIAGWVL